MIAESIETKCPIAGVKGGKTRCPFATSALKQKKNSNKLEDGRFYPTSRVSSERLTLSSLRDLIRILALRLMDLFASFRIGFVQKKQKHGRNDDRSASIVKPPSPPGWKSLPIVGHMPMLWQLVEGGEPAPALIKAFKMCEGDMSSLDIPGENKGLYFTSNADYARVVSTDLENWGKITHKDKRGPFYMARQVIGDALFVASDTEPNWGKAHRILMPAFSPSGLKSLAEITSYKVDRFIERVRSNREPFDIGEAFTSLTFDIIGNYIGGPGLDFGTTEHPERMASDKFLVALDVAMRSRENAQKIFNGRLDPRMYKKRMEAYQALHDSAMDVINDRLNKKTASKDGNPDVLDRMLNTVDKETNEKMDMKLIRNHLILFLLVGHDSTSSLLTSLVYMLTQHPEVENKIREEVEAVIGDSVPTMENIKKLEYTMAVIKETLRLFPPAVALAKNCLKDTTLGPWEIEEGARMVVVVKEVHRNKEYWGENADDFDPSRFLPDSPNVQMHDYAWLPFSSGPRGCIGMQFSLIEARIILARMMQHLTFRLHKDAEAKEKFRTFMKLSNVYVTAHDIDIKKMGTPPVRCRIDEQRIPVAFDPVVNADNMAKIGSHNGRIDIYFGSNTGTCEDLSHRLCNDSKQLGFKATVRPLDAVASEGFQKDRLVLVVTSTYNGQPPDNAKIFAKYCKGIEPNSLSDVTVAIIGVGNSNWKSFQVFPSYIETTLRSAGAKILCSRCVADEEKDLKGEIQSWIGSELWPSAFRFVGLDSNTSADIVDIDRNRHNALDLGITDSSEQSRHLLRSPDNKLAPVISSCELQCLDSGRSTRHIELKLPRTMDYRAGDHLAIFPENDPELVFQFASIIKEHDLGRVVTVKVAVNCDKFRHLPIGIPMTVSDLLGRHIDLQAPITLCFMKTAITSTVNADELNILKGISDLISNDASSNCQQLRPIQILTAFPSIHLTLAQVLATIVPMKKRYYSISSSPKASGTESNIASVTVGLVEGRTTTHPMVPVSHTDSENHRGVSSGYLANLRPGQLAEVLVVRNERFRLPKNAHVPVIMIGPGTGVAPFRGFIQELNMASGQNRRAILFFGCRNEKDFLYRSELESASIELHVAFSRPNAEGFSDQNSLKKPQYVQNLLWENRDNIWQVLEQGAHVYVCGDGRHMAKDVDKTLLRIAVESGKMNENCAIAYFEELQKNGAYLQDVWCN